MSDVLKEARRSAGKVASLETEIAILEQRKTTLKADLDAQKQQLMLSAAKQAGLLERLSPDELVFLIDAWASSAEKPEQVLPAAAAVTEALPSIGSDDRVTIAVGFGNHKSAKVDRLRSHGLTRDGKRGIWHGVVGAQTWAELAELFGPKLTTVAVHPGKNDPRSEIGSELNDDVTSEKQFTAMPSDSILEVTAELQPPPSAVVENSVKSSSLFRGLPPRSFKKQDGTTSDAQINT